MAIIDFCRIFANIGNRPLISGYVFFRKRRLILKVKKSGNELGKFIKDRRLALGLNGAELGRALGLDKTSIYHYEDHQYPTYGSQMSLKLKRKMAKVLKCNVIEIESRLPKRSTYSRKEPTSELGKFIRNRRNDLGLTAKQMAKKVGLCTISIYSYEGGRHHANGSEMSPKLQRKFARALKCTVLEIQSLLPKAKLYKCKKGPVGELGKLLHSRRLELNLSKSEVSRRMGLSSSSYMLIESDLCDLNDKITPERARKLAEALEIPLKKLKPFIDYSLRPTTSMMPAGSILGQFIRTRRVELGMSGEKLGEKLEITRAYVSLMEIGRVRTFRKFTLNDLAKALEVKTKILKTLMATA